MQRGSGHSKPKWRFRACENDARRPGISLVMHSCCLLTCTETTFTAIVMPPSAPYCGPFATGCKMSRYRFCMQIDLLFRVLPFWFNAVWTVMFGSRPCWANCPPLVRQQRFLRCLIAKTYSSVRSLLALKMVLRSTRRYFIDKKIIIVLKC